MSSPRIIDFGHNLQWQQAIAAALILGLGALIIDYSRILYIRSKMPPGPLPLPIVGNVLQFPKEKPWYKFEEWSKKYNNPLITVWIGRNPIVVLNDAWTAGDLMDKRANIYSSRPVFQVPGRLMGGAEWDQPLIPYNDRWRRHRKLMHIAVGAQAVRNHRDIQSHESAILLSQLFQQPDDFVMSVERYSCSVVSIIGWGRRIRRKDDPIVERALNIMHVTAQIFVPGDYWMETIPLLQKLPSWIYALPTALKKGRQGMMTYWYALSKESAENGDRESFSKALFEDKAEGLLPLEIGSLTSNLIGGGVDTTTSTMLSFVLACIAFPEALKKAQEEIDRVVGENRVPDWSDEKNLPYCQAMIKEVLRWRSVAILGGLPHAPIKDDIYRGYLIPEGTSIMGNIWAIHRNPREFPDPDVFKPERYLQENRLPYPNERGYNTFGWGRRQCPGQPLAEQGLFLSLTRIAWAFNVTNALDENGKPIPVDIFAYTNGENMRPRPFKARFIPRTEGIRKLILDKADEGDAWLGRYAGETKVRFEDFFR